MKTNDATLASDYSPNAAARVTTTTTNNNAESVDGREENTKSADSPLSKNNKPSLNGAGNRRAKVINILPNYKKVKKLIGLKSAPPSHAPAADTAPSNQVPGQNEQNLFNLPVVQEVVNTGQVEANSDHSSNNGNNNDRSPPSETSNLESSENNINNDNVIVSNTGKHGNLGAVDDHDDALAEEQGQQPHMPNIVADNQNDDNEHTKRVDNSDFNDNNAAADASADKTE
ncbi:putative uncharacterized protein DDB_G0286901, partial [Musca vetustissima]|uniref:putative uncharacterized protein DDB_G0286901 n=1 Tax=Musca vetustissima TaxID=27455 RepID=UPI002AB69769